MPKRNYLRAALLLNFLRSYDYFIRYVLSVPRLDGWLISLMLLEIFSSPPDLLGIPVI